MANQRIPTQRKHRPHRRHQSRKPPVFFLLCFLLCLLLLLYYVVIQPGPVFTDIFTHAPDSSPILPDDIPDELEELLEKNEETRLFVEEYQNRDLYLGRKIDLSTDAKVKKAIAAGEAPLLLQWDLRWGYAPYGDDMVGLAGCGPACLSMAYIGLTGDTSMNPAAMADFADSHGYYTEYGTDWSLWTDGAGFLGLSGETLALDESAMKNALDGGGLIVCSMRPGDFTTTGHFILIRGYDEDGFLVNDPNRQCNSDRHWTYDELSWQIKNLWSLSAP